MARRRSSAQTARLAYSVATVAELLDMSDSGVRGLIDSGAIHAIRIGRAVRIPAAELIRYGLEPPKTAEIRD